MIAIVIGYLSTLVPYIQSETNKESVNGTAKIVGTPCSISSGCGSLESVTCNLNLSVCQCNKKFPINLGTFCLKGTGIGGSCTYDEECTFMDSNAHCLQDKEGMRSCQCRQNYANLPTLAQGSMTSSCLRVSEAGLEGQDTIPAVVGLAIGLIILTFLLVFVGKLFSKARWQPSRGYGDANIPPTIVIDGKESIENEIFEAGDPFSPEELRKMSILSSVTLPLHKDIMVKSISPSGSQEHQRLFGEGAEDSGEYEQSLTIVSSSGRPRNSRDRRASIADYAFPELHEKPKKKKDGNLLILTRTRTDDTGRRHSVAVPILNTKGCDIQTELLSHTLRMSPKTPRGSVRRNNVRRNSSQNSQFSSQLQSPEKLSKPRRHSQRRSSKQDFLHFLDLAVAS